MMLCSPLEVPANGFSAMASFQLGSEPLLRPLDGSRQMEIEKGHTDHDSVIMNNSDSWMQLTPGSGNGSQLAGFVDYHGGLSDVNTSNETCSLRCQPEKVPQCYQNQLTLFYAGTVTVLENVTAEKAQSIMLLARGGDVSGQIIDTTSPTEPSMRGAHTFPMQPSLSCSPQVHDTLPKLRLNTQEIPTGAITSLFGQRLQLCKEPSQNTSDFLVPYQANVPKALPLARKESLIRFLERRKDRLRIKAPYSVNRIKAGGHHSNGV